VVSILEHNERKQETLIRGGALLSSTSSTCSPGRPDRKPFHIVTTKFLEGNEVLAHFSDGTAAIFEAEELEKLRPTPKRVLPSAPKEHETLVMERAVAAVAPKDAEGPLVLGEAVA
jgi:hypothetical protein